MTRRTPMRDRDAPPPGEAPDSSPRGQAPEQDPEWDSRGQDPDSARADRFTWLDGDLELIGLDEEEAEDEAPEADRP
jgi:hypothetical protein